MKPLAREEQRVARSAGRLAADALIYDTFPDCHIAGGSSWARGWDRDHRTDWDRKGFRIEVYDIDARKPVTVASVTWAAIRRHGQRLPVLCADLKAAIHDDIATGREYHRATNYHQKGDPEAQPWNVRTFGPINQPAIDAAWDRMLIASDRARTRINDLLDEAFPLAVDNEPTDLLELLAAQQ